VSRAVSRTGDPVGDRTGNRAAARWLAAWWRVGVGAAILGAVVWWTGTGPFVEGFRALDARAVVLGSLLALAATVASAWRWRLVAQGLGVGIGLIPAVARCYRSQFLNLTLPGGVLGDVHRGVSHGRGAGNTGRGLRSVAWERVAGQVVQAVVLVLVLLLLPSPVRPPLWVAVGLLLLVALVVTAARGASSRRLVAAVQSDLRSGLLGRRTWPGVVVASTVAVACHVATYVVAARAVGVTAPPDRLVPLALLVLLAAALPVNVAGWGPREGAAGWAFGAAGLGVELGVATAVAYGALALVGNLPGAVVLAAGRRSSGG
jgi:hypothetical protein